MGLSVLKVFQLAFQRAADRQKASDVTTLSQKPPLTAEDVKPAAVFRSLGPPSVFRSLGEREEQLLPQIGAKRKARAPADEVSAAVQAGSSATHGATAIGAAGQAAVHAEGVAAAVSTAADAVNATTTDPTVAVADVLGDFANAAANVAAARDAATAANAAAAAKAAATTATAVAVAADTGATIAITKFVAAADADAIAKATKASTRPRAIGHYPHFVELKNYAQDLSVLDSILYWAYECLPYVLHIQVEPHFHEHTTALLEAIDMGRRSRDFYEGLLSEPGDIAASNDTQFKFWIRFGWLACLFAIGGEQGGLLVDGMDPPHWWEGDTKQWWWKTRLVGSPFHCAMDSRLAKAEDMVCTFEDRHDNASTAAASAAAVCNTAAAEAAAAASAYAATNAAVAAANSA